MAICYINLPNRELAVRKENYAADLLREWDGKTLETLERKKKLMELIKPRKYSVFVSGYDLVALHIISRVVASIELAEADIGLPSSKIIVEIIWRARR